LPLARVASPVSVRSRAMGNEHGGGRRLMPPRLSTRDVNCFACARGPMMSEPEARQFGWLQVAEKRGR
jgi:hypothetical protein